MGQHRGNRREDTSGKWVQCPACGKRTYWSRRAAKLAARRGKGGRPYECTEGSGHWHLTTISAARRELPGP